MESVKDKSKTECTSTATEPTERTTEEDENVDKKREVEEEKETEIEAKKQLEKEKKDKEEKSVKGSDYKRFSESFTKEAEERLAEQKDTVQRLLSSIPPKKRRKSEFAMEKKTNEGGPEETISNITGEGTSKQSTPK